MDFILRLTPVETVFEALYKELYGAGTFTDGYIGIEDDTWYRKRFLTMQGMILIMSKDPNHIHGIIFTGSMRVIFIDYTLRYGTAKYSKRHTWDITDINALTDWNVVRDELLRLPDDVWTRVIDGIISTHTLSRRRDEMITIRSGTESLCISLPEFRNLCPNYIVPDNNVILIDIDMNREIVSILREIFVYDLEMTENVVVLSILGILGAKLMKK